MDPETRSESALAFQVGVPSRVVGRRRGLEPPDQPLKPEAQKAWLMACLRVTGSALRSQGRQWPVPDWQLELGPDR